MSLELGLSRVHFPITTLGPGRRLGIWFQGCSIRCPGCISADTWGPGRHPVAVDQLLDHIGSWLMQADGITISGGEPFDQPHALLALLQRLRQRTRADILVYSGYPIETLSAMLEPLEGLLDALISDPFDRKELQSLALRGSDNQRLHLLTPLGSERFAEFERVATAHDRALDVMFDDDGAVWMAGIPHRDDLSRLRDQLRGNGHQLQTSAHSPLIDEPCQP